MNKEANMKVRIFSVVAMLGASLWLALSFTAGAQAANDLNIRFPLIEIGSPCTSELIVIQATAHIVVAEDDLYFRFHANETGTGTTETGVLYVTNNTFRSSFQNRGGALAFTELFHLNIIRQGETLPADDFTIHGIIHLTETRDGVRAEVDNLRVSCR